MATTPATTTTRAPRKARAPSAPKPVYAVVQVLDESGQPMAISKDRIRIVSFEKSAEAVLNKVESGEFLHAVYLRGLVPAGR